VKSTELAGGMWELRIVAEHPQSHTFVKPRRRDTALLVPFSEEFMPYLQLDVPYEYTSDQKKAAAKRIGAIYSDVMKVNTNIITVTIREVGKGGVWRCSDGDPDEAAIMMLDIRRGRPIEQRAELARQLIEACVELLDLKTNRLNVEFTQHSGDEMYHPILGGFNKDWIEDERSE